MKRIKTNSIGARILSGVLSVLMIMSACPTTAFAEYDEPEDKTIVVENSDTETENKDAVVVVDGSTEEDENVNSIPVDEDADDQTTPDVDVPPNITTEVTEVTTTESTTEKATEATTEAEKFDYSVKLQKDATVNVGDEFVVNADVKATVTVGKKTSDVDYTFEYSVSDSKNVDIKSDNTSATFTFNKEGKYTIEGKMIVDGKTVASDKMKVIVEKELPIIEFDHYFTDIDESLIDTSDLIVTTNDASIFTKNTNVVSNFDNAYIISCDSVEEARYVYSYYVDKVDTITDLSKVISVATEDNDEDVADMSDINDGNDALSKLNDIDVNNYAGYIALIDTGANADVNFSVVGDDTSDSNGHGTKMLNLIKTENPNAKVMSIKVFNGSKTDAASVYAGIKLAVESKVSVINLSLVGSNVEKNAIVKDAIKEAIANGITVIGAAGNYNISAKKFIPGCIDDVIVIGAANEDGTKYATSNTDADYYVVAESTSEATAIYTGLYTAGKLDDKRIFNDIGKNESIDNPDNPNNKNTWYINFAKRYGYDYIVNEDGSISFVIPIENDFETSSPHSESHNTTDITKRHEYDDLSSIKNGTYTSSGTCSFTSSEAGEGTIDDFDGDGVFESAWKSAGSPAIYASCESHWGDENSHYAEALSTGSKYYSATSTVKTSSDKKYKLLDVDLQISDDGVYDINWPSGSHTYKIFGNYHTNSNNGKEFTISGGYTVIEDGELITSTSLENIIVTTDSSSDALNKARARMRSKLDEVLQVYISKYEVSDYGGYRNSSNNTEETSDNNSISYTLTVTYEQADHTQIYRAIFDSYSDNTVDLKLTKNYDSNFKDIVNSSSYYSLDGTVIKAYTDKQCKTALKDINNKDVVLTVPNGNGNKSYSETFTLNAKYANNTIYVKETKTGKGYILDKKVYEIKMGSGGSTKPFTISNIPMFDPPTLGLQKVSNTNGTPDFNGTIKAGNAIYTVTQYNLTSDNKKGKATGTTWTYKTDDDGVVYFDDPNYCISKNTPPSNPDHKGVYTWPIGFYEITETQIPRDGDGHNYGALQSTKVYSYKVYPCNGTKSLGFNKLLYDGTESNWMERTTTGGDGKKTYKRNPNYTITVDTDKTITGIKKITGTTNYVFYAVEKENWLPIGLYKVDSAYIAAGYINKESSEIPEGDASYSGAVYNLYSMDGSIKLDAKYSNPNKTVKLSLGQPVTSVATEDGLGKTGSIKVNNYYPVLADGKQVTITTNSKGIAVSTLKFPESTTYALVEVKSPKGYCTYNKPLKVQSTWTSKADGSTVVSMNTYSKTYTNTATITSAASGGTDGRTGAAPETPHYYGITIRKVDEFNVHGQGDGTTNGIKFAVINKSANHIIVYNDKSNVQYDTNRTKLIEPGQVAAIMTTHTENGVEGIATMNGLPYGTYDVVELRKDASISVGDVYDGSTKLGSSSFANDSYLWDSKNVILNIGLHGEDYTYTAHTDQSMSNKPFVDGFRAYKMDKTDLAITEGFSSANDIKFAVVNKSTRQVRLEKKYVDQLGEDAAFVDYKAHEAIAPGEVVAILTTHDKDKIDGYMSIYGLPYGKYEVHELRRDATIQVGDVYNSSNKLGSDIFANDSYYYKDPAQPLNFTDTVGTGHHACTLEASFAVHNFRHNDENSSFQDEVFRDGFSFWKRDFTFNKLDNHPQGDATFNGIRYAVVNRSDKVVRLFNEYNLVDPKYVTIVNGKDIENGQVAAILTSHQKDKLEGYVAMYGLPYGKYDIYELAADATIAVGDAYDSSNKLGKSIYASAYPDVNTVANAKKNPSMLFDDSLQQTVLFTYTLTDTTNELTKKYDISHIHDVDDTGKNICTDETVYGTLKITKYDAETGQTGADGNQGVNTFAGIKYAVVNRSKNSVSLVLCQDLVQIKMRGSAS